MRILVVHNRYQHAGGEDSVFENEVALLRGGGHDVSTLVETNDTIHGVAAQLSAAAGVIWSPAGQRRMRDAIAKARPDVVHVHNYFPRLSPAIFWTCAAANVPAVWTLHNFRVGCANGLLFRDGRVCEECVPGTPLPAIRHRCYRGSRAGSAAVAGMISTHRRIGTWRNKVARFIALTAFARDRFIAAGLPAERIVVKPNFVDVPVPGKEPRAGALFVGRLSAEKGVDVLVDAWSRVSASLDIIGDGPERAALERSAPANVRFLGPRPRGEVADAMARCALLVVPSIWFENFPMTVVEAMAQGTPVLASRLGALAHIVEDGVTGLHFAPGDADDLAKTAAAALVDPARLAAIGAAARAHYERELSPAVNLMSLEGIYHDAMADAE